ncbi:putative spermidine/putrescine transport system permease protein [Rhodoligotrophos appendicifer]|uniref:ABC transporter permease n=1 Tax=Rhodoligotrophos appendicifer TaxID=987056 RepID=UPI001185D377|nr:ABC transporter permease [Rhodoligotrophos appendicifer]
MEQHVPHSHRFWLYGLTALTLLFLIAPTFIVVPMSFSSSRSLIFPPPGWSLQWYENFFTRPQWQDATFVSLRVSFLTMLCATPIGVAAAYGLHVGRFRLNGTIYGALISPLMVPVILISIGLYFVYAQLGMVNTTLGLVLADTMIAVPFVLVTVSAGLKTYDMNQEMVARSLGAHRLWAFLTVTLPQIRYSVISGALLAFIVAFDEVIIAMLISGGEGATLTKRMFSSLRDEVDPTIAAISTLLLILTTVPPLILHYLANRKKTP